MLRRAMSSVLRRAMLRPAKPTSPSVFTMPHRARRVVVLPAPFAPSSAVIDPSSMRKSSPCSTRVCPYAACRRSTSSSAKVGLYQLGVAAHFRGRALRDAAAEVERDHPVGDAHHQVHVMLD